MQQQHGLREVTALDLRRVALVAALVAERGPQAVTSARRGASGAALALVCTGAADRLQQQRADAALRIITGHAGGAAVHHMTDALNGDAGLRDVSGDDDLAQRAGGEGAVLLLRFQFTVQRKTRHALLCSQAPQRVQRAADLAAPGHEDEDVARGIAVEDALHGFHGLHRDGACVRERKIADFHGVALPLGNEDRARIQIRGHRLGIQRGGHDDHHQVRALVLL